MHDYFKQDGLVGHDFLHLVRFDHNASEIKQLFIKVKIDRDLAAVGKSKGLLDSFSNNDVSKIAGVGCNVDAVEVLPRTNFGKGVRH